MEANKVCTCTKSVPKSPERQQGQQGDIFTSVWALALQVRSSSYPHLLASFVSSPPPSLVLSPSGSKGSCALHGSGKETQPAAALVDLGTDLAEKRRQRGVSTSGRFVEDEGRTLPEGWRFFVPVDVVPSVPAAGTFTAVDVA